MTSYIITEEDVEHLWNLLKSDFPVAGGELVYRIRSRPYNPQAGVCRCSASAFHRQSECGDKSPSKIVCGNCHYLVNPQAEQERADDLIAIGDSCPFCDLLDNCPIVIKIEELREGKDGE